MEYEVSCLVFSSELLAHSCLFRCLFHLWLFQFYIFFEIFPESQKVTYFCKLQLACCSFLWWDQMWLYQLFCRRNGGSYSFHHPEPEAKTAIYLLWFVELSLHRYLWASPSKSYLSRSSFPRVKVLRLFESLLYLISRSLSLYQSCLKKMRRSHLFFSSFLPRCSQRAN